MNIRHCLTQNIGLKLLALLLALLIWLHVHSGGEERGNIRKPSSSSGDIRN
jgi:hypothetical protein